MRREVLMDRDRRMKSAFVLLAIVVISCATGCGDRADQIPPESSRVTVEEIVETRQLLVQQVLIEAAGKRRVRIDDMGGNIGPVTVEPEQDTGRILAEITFVAFLEEASESAGVFWWMTQIEGPGSTAARGPSAFPVEADGLTDVLRLGLEQGLYVLGQDVRIGRFREEPIVLSVK